MRKVTILIPCYNESASLGVLRERLLGLIDGSEAGERYDWEILLVNDGSRDDTLDILRRMHSDDPRFCYLDLSRNFGKECAMLAGLDYATGDCVVIMDADLQHPPEVIPQMLELWEQGWEDVYARRTTRGRESWMRRWLSLAYYRLLQRSSRFDVLQNVGDFRLLDRCCVDALCRMRESERYMKGMFCWIGFRKKEIFFEQGSRETGESSMSYRNLFNLAIEGITSFTTSPLRISSVMGFVVSLGAFVYMIYVLVKALVMGDPVAGFPSLMIVLLFLGGVQLLSIGIIGEYLGRIFNETKHRPPYIAREHNGEKV